MGGEGAGKGGRRAAAAFSPEISTAFPPGTTELCLRQPRAPNSKFMLCPSPVRKLAKIEGQGEKELAKEAKATLP